METAQDLVREIARENPIIPDDWTNLCKFCGACWAERDYEEYLRAVETLKQNSDALMPNGIHRMKNEHHDDDCLWLRCNRIVANEVS